MTTPENKLDTVRKLLAKAERAATPEEAEAYNVKAAELMARHGIDSALLAASGERRDDITRRRITMADPYSREKATLLGYIAAPLHCRAVLHMGSGRGTVEAVTVFGHGSDLERIEILFTSLLLQATTGVVHRRPHWSSSESVAAYRRSWLQGFAVAVHHRLDAAERVAVSQHDQAAATGAPGAALVLANRKQLVDRAYAAEFPGVRKSGRRELSGTGMGAGIRAGRRADLGDRRITTIRRAIGG